MVCKHGRVSLVLCGVVCLQSHLLAAADSFVASSVWMKSLVSVQCMEKNRMAFSMQECAHNTTTHIGRCRFGRSDGGVWHQWFSCTSIRLPPNASNMDMVACIYVLASVVEGRSVQVIQVMKVSEHTLEPMSLSSSPPLCVCLSALLDLPWLQCAVALLFRLPVQAPRCA